MTTLTKERYKGHLCGKCLNPAIGSGRIPPGQAHVYVCEEHKKIVVEFKPFV